MCLSYHHMQNVDAKRMDDRNVTAETIELLGKIKGCIFMTLELATKT